MFKNFSWSFWPSCPFYWRQKLTNNDIFRKFHIFSCSLYLSLIKLQIMSQHLWIKTVSSTLNVSAFFRIYSDCTVHCGCRRDIHINHLTKISRDADIYIILLTKINRDVVIGQNSNYTVSFCVIIYFPDWPASVTQHTPTEHNIAIMHEVFLKLYDRYRMLLQLGYITGHQVNKTPELGIVLEYTTILILNLGPSAPPPQKKEKEFVIKM